MIVKSNKLQQIERAKVNVLFTLGFAFKAYRGRGPP